MRQAILIRTHQYGTPETRLIDSLRGLADCDVILCFDTRTTAAPSGGPAVVEMPADTPQKLGVAAPQDWAWRCGDFCYYAAAAAHPGYDRYWLIEPDVVFNKVAPDRFFAQALGWAADFMVTIEGRAAPHWPHHSALAAFFDQPRQCFFPVTSLSARAVAYLHDQRRAYGRVWSDRGADAAAYANDEGFVASAVHAHPDLTCQPLKPVLPAFYPDGLSLFSWRRLVMDIDLPHLPAGLVHPVVDQATFEARILGPDRRSWMRRDRAYLEAVLSRHYPPARAADILSRVRWKPGS